MYAASRATAIWKGLLLGGILIASLVAGGLAGHAISARRSVTSQADARVAAAEQLAAFRATELQGSIENPDAVQAQGPSNTSFLESEHQGSIENPDAVQGPSNTMFLASEHQGSIENPDAAQAQGPSNTRFLASEHQP